MSQFQPTQVAVDPPPAPDYFAVAVLQGLSRPIGGRLNWGVVKSVFLGAISFGFLPILSWTRTFRAFVNAEREQFTHLAEWVRHNSVHPLARQLESTAADMRPRAVLSWLAIFVTVATAAGIFVNLNRTYFPWDHLYAGTYAFGKPHRFAEHHQRFFGDSRVIFGFWASGLGVAYAFHWLQVRLHAEDVKRFVACFSQIAEAEGVNRVKAASLGTTLRPLWLVGGAVFYMMGAPWGIVAMLAGAAHRRYITGTSRDTRADLAQRLRAMMMRRRPVAAGAAAVPVYLRDRCVEPKCRAEIPRGVNFCPRCGTRQKARVNRVA